MNLDDRVKKRIDKIEKNLKVSGMDALICSRGEYHIIHRLNMIISLMTLMIDQLPGPSDLTQEEE